MNKTKDTVKAPVTETPPVVPSPAFEPVAPAPTATPIPVVSAAPPATDANAPTEGAAATPPPSSSQAAAPAPEVGQTKPQDTDPKPVVFTAADRDHAAKQREAKAFEQQLLHLRRQHPVIEKLCKEMELLKAELAALKKK